MKTTIPDPQKSDNKESFFYTFPSIMEINLLMAKFMGGTPQPHGRLTIIKWGEWIPPFPMMQLDHLPFHSSYEWIMPVIEKIQSEFGDDIEFMTRMNSGYERGVLKHCAYITVKLDPDRDKMEKEYFIQSSNSHIESIYRTAYQFIEWYNKRRGI